MSGPLRGPTDGRGEVSPAPSPWNLRGLEWAKDLPGEGPLALRLHLARAPVPPEVADSLREAVHSFFAGRSMSSVQRLRRLFRTGRISLVIGMVFLAACLLLGDWIVRLRPASHLAEVARESLLIGGWVAMWRPLEIFLYDWWPIRNERRLYDKLSRAAVQIVCTDPRAPA